MNSTRSGGKAHTSFLRRAMSRTDKLTGKDSGAAPPTFSTPETGCAPRIDGARLATAYAEEEEAALAVVVVAAPSPALIAWHHGAIPRLVTEIAGKLPGCPVHWPDDRFDLIWILERNAPRAAWSFSQVTQRLLAGDGTDGTAP